MNLDGLLDTNILIDVSRRYSPAVAWLQGNSYLFAVSSITRMELILGSRNKVEQQKIVGLLQSHQLVYPDAVDAQWAMEQFEAFYLSHQIEAFDCFIGATAVRLGIPVFTRNVRDLALLPGVVIKVPY